MRHVGVASSPVRWSTSVRARTLSALIATAFGGFGASAAAQSEPPETKDPALTAPPETPPPAEPPKEVAPEPAPPKTGAAETAAKAPEPSPASPKEPELPPPSTGTSPKAEPAKAEEKPPTGFTFGSYGRMIAATDGRGGPGRNADLVARGSRLDESNYVELELRRDDYWEKTKTRTRVVATLAITNPVFHYNGDFNIKMGVRNLYIEEKGLGLKDLSVWVGSRMYRGDDIYLLDFWPLDSLNTIGAGARYNFSDQTMVAVHGGLNQPSGIFYKQDVERPSAANAYGINSVTVLDRQKFIGSLKASHIVKLGATAGLKGVLYGEAHALPSGQKETDPGIFEDLPSDDGYVIGAQVGAYTTTQRDTHVNIFIRYARGIAAYGEWGTPFALALDRTTAGAHEFLAAFSGNWEMGPVGIMAGGYVRSFRNASPDLDFNDVDEVIGIVRPHLFFGELGGLAVEFSQQLQKRGVLVAEGQAPGQVPPPGAAVEPLTGGLTRIGVIPFLSPAGRGDYSRPQFRLIYEATLRSDGARQFYAQDDIFNLRSVEHFFGVGAEWWFNASYGW